MQEENFLSQIPVLKGIFVYLIKVFHKDKNVLCDHQYYMVLCIALIVASW